MLARGCGRAALNIVIKENIMAKKRKTAKKSTKKTAKKKTSKRKKR